MQAVCTMCMGNEANSQNNEKHCKEYLMCTMLCMHHCYLMATEHTVNVNRASFSKDGGSNVNSVVRKPSRNGKPKLLY